MIEKLDVVESDAVALVRIRLQELIPDHARAHSALCAGASFRTDVPSLSAEIFERCRILKAGAKAGDAASFEALVHLAALFCSGIEESFFIHPETRKGLARKKEAWPVLLPIHPEQQAKAIRRIQNLPLAEGLGISLPKNVRSPDGKTRRRKTYSFETLANQVVETEFRRLKVLNPSKYDLSARNVTAATVQVWFEEIWQRIRDSGALKADPHLRALGVAYAESKRDLYPSGSATYETNLIEGVRQRLRSAIEQMFVQKKDD